MYSRTYGSLYENPSENLALTSYVAHSSLAPLSSVCKAH